MEIIVNVVGTEKYYVEGASNLEEAKKIIVNGDATMIEQDLDFISETFEEI